MIKKLVQYKNAYGFYQKKKPTSKMKKVLDLIKFIMDKRFVTYDGLSYMNYAGQFSRLLEKVSTPHLINNYVYPLDVDTLRCISKETLPIASVTVDYEKLLSGSLTDKRKELEYVTNSDFKEALKQTLDSLNCFIDKTSNTLLLNKDERSHVVANYLKRIKGDVCQSFDEAIQRILFFNGLLWQNGHMQNGIGRLDLILSKYYDKGIKDGSLCRESAKVMLSDMIRILGKDMLYKSAALPGDTGQIIILGGIDENRRNVENDITHILLEIYRENPVPDPKLLVRVNTETGQEIWRKSIDSILTGCGSPLLLNEKLIMRGLSEFGYDDKDVWNFATSACWEPLIIGKSFDQNNRIPNITILDALSNSLSQNNFTCYQDFEDDVLKNVTQLVSTWPTSVHFDKSPLMTLLFDDCINSEKDFCSGGAKYNYHGLLVVGLPNLVNSMLNIRDYVFDKKILTLENVKTAISDNYEGHTDILQLFKSNRNKFGLATDDVVQLTNRITTIIDQAMKDVRILNNRAKVGFSSPGYIGLAKTYPASPDGRKNGEPFAVHISPITSDIDIHQIFDFASKMDYSGSRINGNVVDFIIPSSYAKEREKLTGIVKSGMLSGIYELQMNVLDKDTLIDAKQHPDKYPNLIVRVWGFSAYFNDLPEEYKDNLIARAETYES